MEFRFTAEQQAFRQEVRDFLLKELPKGWATMPGSLQEDDYEFGQEFLRRLAPKKWIVPAWPEEYGGLGLGLWEQVVFNEEMAYQRAPLLNFAATGYLGPTIMMYGTDEQKAQHLPGITSNTVQWCQGYSEPGSGSDLASLQTKAVEDGDEFVINGQKIWTSQANYADWMFMLARTDSDAPKHKGISYFLVDMKTPGITVRPLINMAGQAGFNEVFFEDVRVPRSGLVGELNRGWYIATTTLDFERSSSSASGGYQRSLEELTKFTRETKANGKLLIQKPKVRAQIADLAVELNLLKLLSYRVVTLQSQKQVPNYESSIVKTFGTEYYQRLSNAGLNILGLYGGLEPGSKYARLNGEFGRAYLTSVGSTIAAGTTEIQKNIIATRGLGLPRN